MSKDDVVIRVEHVGKTFEPQSSTKTVKEGFVGLGRKLTGKKAISHHKGEYTALKDISFDIKKGDFFGIVGRNGCGKSTLLKILAGVYSPTIGHVQVKGKLTPFIELGVGFNPELSGRDNVFLNGALLGFSRKQMEDMYDDIVDFAELHDFMDTKLKNYSSGMQVRLAFSVAIRADTDILLIDEVLAVGDYDFQQKCFSYFGELKKRKKTVILVSHDEANLERYCEKGIYIDNSKIVKMGKIREVLLAYSKDIIARNNKASNNSVDKSIKEDYLLEQKDGFILTGIKTLDGSGVETKTFAPKEKIHIRINILAGDHLINPTAGIVISDSSGKAVFATNTIDQDIELQKFIKGKSYEIVFTVDNVFANGRYYISGAVADSTRSNYYIRFLQRKNFSVAGWVKTATGLVFIPCKIYSNEI